MIDFSHPGSADPVAGTPEWDAFMESAVWADIKNFLEEKLELVKYELLDAEDWDETIRLQQEGKVTDVMLGLPEFLKQFAKTNEVKQ